MSTPTTRFNRRLQEIPASLWSLIVKIDELKGQWVGGARLSPQTLGRLKRSVLVTSTGASTRIEGARLSDEDVEKLMRGIAIQKFADRDQQEVQGYFELLQNVFDAWKTIQFSESTIKHFHRELLKFVEKDQTHCGEYKRKENKVHMIDEAGQSKGILFDTTPAYLTPKAMQELVEWTQQALREGESHPLIIIGHFLVEFLKIHPFEDGNGRLSRILTNFLLLQQGYAFVPYVSHEKLVEDHKPDYYLTLRKSQKTLGTDQEDITPWLEFFFRMFLTQSQLAVALLTQEDLERVLSPKQLAVWQYLQSVSEATPGDIAKHSKVVRITVNQALTKLLQMKRIERLGMGRSTRYRVISK